MDIPGITPFSNQPTLTNPLNSDNQLTGRQTAAQQITQTTKTTLVEEQSAATLGTSIVVNQAKEIDSQGFNPENPGGTIDLTV